MSEGKKGTGNARRTFLVGLLTGAGVVAAATQVAASPKPSRRKRAASVPQSGADRPVLYRRTAEAERYYKTL